MEEFSGIKCTNLEGESLVPKKSVCIPRSRIIFPKSKSNSKTSLFHKNRNKDLHVEGFKRISYNNYDAQRIILNHSQRSHN